tara:strand:+ start:1743 stop:2531 length:789 start_codon:yes stop_codon:yes gene_type:complete
MAKKMKVSYWVISLANSVWRKEINNNLKAVSNEIKIFDAIDARNISKLELDRIISADEIAKNMGRELALAEIACAASHLQIYEKFLLSSDDCIVVFEDDAELIDENIDKFVKKFFEKKIQTPTIVSFFSGEAYAISFTSSEVLKCITPPLNTVGYAMNKLAAQNILDGTNHKVLSTADWPSVKNIQFYVTKKPRVKHLGKNSSIEKFRVNLKAPSLFTMIFQSITGNFINFRVLQRSVLRILLKIISFLRFGVTAIKHKDGP